MKAIHNKFNSTVHNNFFLFSFLFSFSIIEEPPNVVKRVVNSLL